jgi:hypothetical protein
MKLKSLLSILSLMFVCIGIANAQSPSDTIPFTLNSQSNICIRASINGADSLLLMFHSSNSGVALTAEAAAKMATLKDRQNMEVNTWGGKATSQYSENNQLTISKLRWDSLTVFLDEYSGVGTDGKFGYDLFDGKIVEIDYDHSRFIVHSEMPRLPSGYAEVGLMERRGSLYIPGLLKMGRTVYRDTFMFHTGYGGTVLLDPKIGERYGMQARLKTISTSELKDSFGNVFKIETKELPRLRLGGKRLKNVPLSFAARSSDIPMKVFGNGLLKRFNVVFGFQRQRLFMKPNRGWGLPFEKK